MDEAGPDHVPHLTYSAGKNHEGENEGSATSDPEGQQSEQRDAERSLALKIHVV
jgi:hypothetical protein